MKITRSPYNHLILLVALLVHLVVGVSQAQGFVWCFEFGAEVSLESMPLGGCDAVGPCNDTSGEEHPGGPGYGSTDADACGECLDLPALSSSFWQSFSTKADSFSPVLPPALPARVFPSFALLEAVPGFRPQPPPPLQPTLAILRTVVLRN
jgi:hypothetical protein